MLLIPRLLYGTSLWGWFCWTRVSFRILVCCPFPQHTVGMLWAPCPALPTVKLSEAHFHLSDFKYVQLRLWHFGTAWCHHMWPWHLKIISIHFLIQSINKVYCHYTAEIETNGRETNNTCVFQYIQNYIYYIMNALPPDQPSQPSAKTSRLQHQTSGADTDTYGRGALAERIYWFNLHCSQPTHEPTNGGFGPTFGGGAS